MLKRILCALLASLMLVGTLASCAETNEPAEETKSETGAETTADTAAAGDTVESEGEDTLPPLDIPDTKYTGKTLTFLTRDEREWTSVEIYSAGITDKSDNINDSVYERNMILFEKYGITIQEMKEPTENHSTKVTNEIAGSNGDFQAISTNTSNSASFATKGQLWDLNNDIIEYMDFTKPWWDSTMAEGMSIHDRLFFATGDLFTLDNDATFVLLFNKQIAEDNQIPNLYDLVHKKEWTMEKFYELASRSSKEQNGNDTLEYDEDIAGFAYTANAPLCFLIGGGITLCTKDENDHPLYNLNIERAQAISDMGDKLFDKKYSLDLEQFLVDGLRIMQVGQINFGGGHSLFFAEVMQSVTRMRGYDVDFGILPFPLYDLEQENYYSMMHQTASQVSIPKSITGEKLEMVNAMIEAMAYYSVDTLTHQYYEINLKTRDAKDVESGPMIDMILASRPCDLSYYFGWGGAFSSVAETLKPTSNTSVSSLNKRFSSRLTIDIDKTVDSMDKNSAQDE